MCRRKPGFKGLPRNQMETENPRGVRTQHSCLLFFCRVCQGDEWARRGNRARAGLAAEGCRVSPSPLHLWVGAPWLWPGALGVGEEKVNERPQFSLLGGLSPPRPHAHWALTVGPFWGPWGLSGTPSGESSHFRRCWGRRGGGRVYTWTHLGL